MLCGTKPERKCAFDRVVLLKHNLITVYNKSLLAKSLPIAQTLYFDNKFNQPDKVHVYTHQEVEGGQIDTQHVATRIGEIPVSPAENFCVYNITYMHM